MSDWLLFLREGEVSLGGGGGELGMQPHDVASPPDTFKSKRACLSARTYRRRTHTTLGLDAGGSRGHCSRRQWMTEVNAGFARAGRRLL